MTGLNNKIESFKNILNNTLMILNEIDDENFRYNLKRAKDMMQNAHNLRQELKVRFGSEELKIFEKDLSDVAKQVSDKFDSIITNKRLELEIVSKKLILLQNQKKLINYSR